VGNVVIEDDVEIGCNTCVDRAMIGTTLIRQGTKIDNQVQVAHNNRIGKHVILAGQVGLSGSVSVGDYTVMGGRVGVVDHVNIGERVTIGVMSLVTKSVPDGETIWGFPARPARTAKRQVGFVNRLPLLAKSLAKLLDRMRHAEGRLARLEERSP
jgi:UDP-3-O-[3-hydroxymyristoyl] glucosamine N-acyltransferase